MDWHSDVHTVARSGACTEDQLDVEEQMRQVAFDTYNMHEFSNHSILLKTVNPHSGTVDVCVCRDVRGTKINMAKSAEYHSESQFNPLVATWDM